MTSIRVLHIIPSLGRGGAERQLVNLITSQDRSAVQHSVITLSNRLDFEPMLQAIGVKVMSLNLPRFRDIPIAAARIYGMLKTLQPDVMHTWLTHADLCGRIAAIIAGNIPVISSIQAPFYEKSIFLDNAQQKQWKIEIIRYLDKITGYFSKALYVGCSASIAAAIQQALKLSNQQVCVIYNSVQIQPLKQTTLHDQLPAKLISIGRLVPQKGHRYLIAALPKVLQQYPQLRVEILGDGPNEQELRRQTCELGLQAHVHFLGLQANILPYLYASDLFISPSLWEGLSLALLEALAVGLPVVATDIPASREIIDNDVQGILVPPQNAEALADAIIMLLADPVRCQMMSLTGRNRIAERFDIMVTSRQWQSLYQKVLGQA